MTEEIERLIEEAEETLASQFKRVEQIAMSNQRRILDAFREHRLTEELLRTGSCDSSYNLPDVARFRVNVFAQMGNYAVVLRKLNTVIPSLSDLKLPDIFLQVAEEKTGLVLVTGATGSGISTTLAALLNQVNESKSIHVITLEDPIEFVHPQKQGTFNQREMGSDFQSFSSGFF